MKHNTVCTKQYLPNKYISQLYDDLKYDGQKGLTNRVEHDKSKGDSEAGIEHGEHHTTGCLWGWMPISCQVNLGLSVYCKSEFRLKETKT